MPFFQAPSATTGCGVLRDEYRVAAKWRLFAIVLGLRHRQTLANKVSSMFDDSRQAFAAQILEILSLQMKLGSESRSCQGRK